MTYEWIQPSEMKPSDRRKWSIDRHYICHPIGVNTHIELPIDGKHWREYVIVVWNGPNRAQTFSLRSNYWVRPVGTGKVKVPVQLMLI